MSTDRRTAPLQTDRQKHWRLVKIYIQTDRQTTSTDRQANTLTTCTDMQTHRPPPQTDRQIDDFYRCTNDCFWVGCCIWNHEESDSASQHNQVPTGTLKRKRRVHALYVIRWAGYWNTVGQRLGFHVIHITSGSIWTVWGSLARSQRL